MEVNYGAFEHVWGRIEDRFTPVIVWPLIDGVSHMGAFPSAHTYGPRNVCELHLRKLIADAISIMAGLWLMVFDGIWLRPHSTLCCRPFGCFLCDSSDSFRCNHDLRTISAFCATFA